MGNYALKDYYANHLRTVRGLKESTVKHYFEGLRKVSQILLEGNIIKESIYEIGNLDELENCISILKMDNKFLELDKRGHQMYSAAVNNYMRFAEGDDFFKSEYSFEQIDIPLIVKEEKMIYSEVRSRSSIIKLQSLKASKYECEIDHNHRTFTAKSNHEQYMEGHHLIPLNAQQEFKHSLDNYANIVCLCPICHRLLHYGVEEEKKEYLNNLYENRYTRLCHSGIEISRNDFLELTL